jgi:hypothetical protein
MIRTAESGARDSSSLSQSVWGMASCTPAVAAMIANPLAQTTGIVASR